MCRASVLGAHRVVYRVRPTFELTTDRCGRSFFAIRHRARTSTLVQIRAPHRISEEHHTRRQCEMLHELLAGTRYGLIIVQSQFSRQPALLEMPD